jgi:hypothetical protein
VEPLAADQMREKMMIPMMNSNLLGSAKGIEEYRINNVFSSPILFGVWF